MISNRLPNPEKTKKQQRERDDRAYNRAQRGNINDDCDSDSVIIVEEPPEIIDLLSD